MLTAERPSASLAPPFGRDECDGARSLRLSAARRMAVGKSPAQLFSLLTKVSCHAFTAISIIETIPDRNLLPEPFTGTAEPFPKPLHHQVIAISFVSAQITRIGGIERYDVEECRTGGTLASTEPELLRGFWGLIDREKPRVVTWNGRAFDLPVLAQRALIHGIPMRYWHQAGDRWNTYRQRYAAARRRHRCPRSLGYDDRPMRKIRGALVTRRRSPVVDHSAIRRLASSSSPTIFCPPAIVIPGTRACREARRP